MTAERKVFRQDLSLLAVEAAEELARLRKGQDSNFDSFRAISKILAESADQNLSTSNSNYRLDYFTVFSSAGLAVKKNVSEIVKEATSVASTINKNQKVSKSDALDKLISFFIALSDRAALYNEELDELKRQLA